MKKTLLTFALALGVLSIAAEVRAQKNQSATVTVTSPEAPPPDCWPICGNS